MSNFETLLTEYCRTNNIPMPVPEKFRPQVDSFLDGEIRKARIEKRHAWRDQMVKVEVDFKKLIGVNFQSRPRKDA